MAEKNIKLVIEYDGSAFCGWQSQKSGDSVQDEIERAINKTTGQTICLLGAGRTDAGVHALGQVANFKIDHDLEPSRYKEALNYYLPKEIRIKSSAEAELSFHARYDATFRRYRYLATAEEKSAIYSGQRWEVGEKLDLDLLKAAAKLVLGEHDFTSFCVVSSRKEDNRCRIERSDWRSIGPLLVYEIRGNRFLHSMIRSLVGGMVNLARRDPDKNKQNLTLDQFENIIKSGTEERITFTAPAHGLYLVSVGYDKGKQG